MKQLELFKKLLPGFIPLIVYIAADEIWGMKTGLTVALATGAAEMAIAWFRQKRIDKFVLLDTALLVVFSGVSILLENDLFFKLKPALLELILSSILGVSAFSSFNIVGSMSMKYMKDIKMTADQESAFRENIRNLFWLINAHIGLIIYSAFYLSKEAWGFVSSILLYLLIGLYFAYQLYLNKRRISHSPLKPSDPEELLPLVDEEGMVIGKAPRSFCHKGEKLLHPVVHLHVMNQNGWFFLQKRPLNKLIQPGKWDTSVGGHISFGEDLQTALNREAFEEIGLKEFSARFIARYKWETDIESELVYSFATYDFKKIKLHTEEVPEGKFWSPAQIERNLGKDVFTPNFEFEYSLIKNGIKHISGS